jgi:hypothetical protein
MKNYFYLTLFLAMTCAIDTSICQMSFSTPANLVEDSTDQEALRLAQYLYGGAPVEEEIVTRQARSSFCATREAMRLDELLRSGRLTDKTMREISRLADRAVLSLDKTYDTQNFTIDFNSTIGDNDCVFEPTVYDPNARTTKNERVPVYVKSLGDFLEKARATYLTNGFNMPYSSGRINVDIRKLDEGYDKGSFGVTNAFNLTVDENMMFGRDRPRSAVYSLLKTTAAHELFHKEQYASYYSMALVPDWVVEGTAHWAADVVFDEANDYITDVNGAGCLLGGATLEGSDYDAVLFWKFLCEHSGTPTSGSERGISLVKRIWQTLNDRNPTETVSTALSLEPGTMKSFDVAFQKFAVTNYCKDLSYNQAPDGFKYGYEENRQPYYDYDHYAFRSGYDQNRFSMASFRKADGTYRTSYNIPPYKSTYYVAECAGAEMVDCEFAGVSPASSAYAVTALLIGSNRLLGVYPLSLSWDVSRSRSIARFARVVSGFDRIVFVVSGLSRGGSYDFVGNFDGRDAYEPDDTYQQAKIVVADRGVQYHSIAPQGDKDWVKCSMARFKYYTIETTTDATGKAIDTYLYFFSTNGSTILKIDDNGGRNGLSKMTYRITVSGTYYIRAQHKLFSGMGGYGLKITSSYFSTTVNLNVRVLRSSTGDIVKWDDADHLMRSSEWTSTVGSIPIDSVAYVVEMSRDLGETYEEMTSSAWSTEVKVPQENSLDSTRVYRIKIVRLTSEGVDVIAVSHPSAELSRSDDPFLPACTMLRQNYPNPFNPVTTIQYELAKSSRVLVEVFDALGRRVEIVCDEVQAPGEHRKTFDAHLQSSGVYFVRLTAGDYRHTIRAILQR